MSMLLRTFLSLKKSWLRNLILTVIFAVIFAVVFSCGAIYSSSQKSIDEVSKLTSGALTIYGGDLSYNMTNSGWKSPYLKDAEAFADSEYVETYNLALQPASTAVVSEGMELFIRSPEAVAAQGPYDYEAWGKEHIYGVTDSEMCEAFSIYGYTLVDGVHITPADKGTDGIIISEEYAEVNGLSIGDSITFHPSSYYGMDPSKGSRTFTVTGIFAPPPQERKVYEFANEDPANYMFAETYYLLDWLDRDYVAWATVYLKDPADVEAFLDEASQKIDIRSFMNRFSSSEKTIELDVPENTSDLSWDEAPWYTVQWDNDWFEMVAKPTASVQKLSATLAAVLLAGGAAVLLLISVINVRLRKREYGLLLAMGESKGKVATQAVMEAFVPIILALLLGIVLSLFVTTPMMENYTQGILDTQAEETNEDTELKGITTDFEKNVTDASALQSRMNSKVKARSDVEMVTEPSTMALCAVVIIALAAVVIMMQMLLILKTKPADILRQKK